MIRIGFECALVFILPALMYYGYKFVIGEMADTATGKLKSASEVLDEAPLAWLFAAGCALLVGTLLAFTTLQEPNINKPYEPAVYKDGRIQQGATK
jgi:hypothetical protein